MENTISRLCNIMRKRSLEHKLAISRLEDLPGQMASVLRMELDSMVRVIYLLSINDFSERQRLCKQTINGERWTFPNKSQKKEYISDRHMVNLADKLQGWTCSVYKFGCAFIHLSNFHDYSDMNPFESLNEKERKNILLHMRYYHGGPTSDKPTFDELSRYFPRIFEKISGNLNCYINSLDKNESLS